jgi:NitT/TauT family transport system permease protein
MIQGKHSLWIMPLLSGIVIFAIWYGIGQYMVFDKMATEELTKSEADNIRRIMIPYPHEIYEALVEERETLWAATRNTLTAAVVGFLCSAVMGYLIANLLAASYLIKQALYPWVLILQMTPVVILAPIFVIWLGQGLPSIAMVTFMIGFFPVVANTTMGLVSTDKNLIDLFQICNARKSQEILLLRIPYAMPYFLTGLKIAGTLAPIGAITGDIFVGSSASGSAGIGFMTIVYNSQLKIPALFATALVACILGFVFVGCVNLLHWWALRNWHDSMVRKEH